MEDLDHLTAQQERDDTTHQDPQRLGHARTVSWNKFVDVGRDFGPDAEDVTILDKGGPAPEGSAPQRGTWRPNKVHPLHRPQTGHERHALALAVEPFTKELTIPQWDAIRLCVFGQLSLRQAGSVLGISHVAVLKRLRSAAKNLRPVIERRTGSEGMDFPPERSFDENDSCRIRPQDGYAHDCEGHFDPAVCDTGCGTVLPTHYNAHTTCRVHSHGKTTRYQFNLAELIRIGLKSLGGQTRRTRRPVRGRPVRNDGRAT